jgi:hypothetical protein
VRALQRVWVSQEGPYAFRWQRRYVRVAKILDSWRDVGEWWNAEPELWFWRVQGMEQGVYELAWDPQNDRWWLYRIYD